MHATGDDLPLFGTLRHGVANRPAMLLQGKSSCVTPRGWAGAKQQHTWGLQSRGRPGDKRVWWAGEELRLETWGAGDSDSRAGACGHVCHNTSGIANQGRASRTIFHATEERGRFCWGGETHPAG